MNKLYATLTTALFLVSGYTLRSQNTDKLQQLGQILSYNSNGEPTFIKLGTIVYESNADEFLEHVVINDPELSVEKIKTERDQLGYSHTKFNLFYKNIPIKDHIIIVHSLNGKIVSINGSLNGAPAPTNSINVDENTALQSALHKVNAKRYKWENKGEENLMKQVFNDPSFTYLPKGELILFNVSEMNKTTKSYYAYQFNIYAEEPLYRANVIVDAQNGSILAEQNLLCASDVTATANTKYSGTQTMTTDNFGAGQYRLRETSRGNGIETYNLNGTGTYSLATDFTNTATSWTNTNVDQVATDAHWGAEMTYDYYLNKHSRNSIDGNGFKLVSYVHYSTNYNNAFWNGVCMTYGDGDGSTFTPLTALDVCGHEITHGLTAKTASLVYSYESGALNESYSDIFGLMVENYGRPTNWNWKVGEDMTPNGNGIRNMQNPNLFGDPDTYLGTGWATGTADNGGVHTNSGVNNYWFYLLSMGGAGVNDNSATYTVTGISMVKAANIAFRALTVYFTPGTKYYDARAYSLQAAMDLYGMCSPEVQETTNAWYAVGVGPQYSPTFTTGFSAPVTAYCTYPATVSFTNTTGQALNYFWDFGDGSTSTAYSPVKTYTANGIYTVKLKANGCSSQSDSITKTAYISVSIPAAGTGTGAARCGPGSVSLTASGGGQQYWYTNYSPTSFPVYIGNMFATPTLTANKNYYVVNTFTNPGVFGAATSTAMGTSISNFAGNTSYEEFDVLLPAVLRSVVVYANGASQRIIQLRNSNNNVVASSTVNLPDGMSTVNLNFKLNPGTKYRLGLGASLAYLYINNSGASYPYNISNLVSITGSSGSSSFYYYFYNWEVAPGNCGSAPVTVAATINPLPSISFLNTETDVSLRLCVSESPITLSVSPSGGVFSGPGVSGNTFDPSIGAGNYYVKYSVTGTNGCSKTDSTNIIVEACVGIKSYEKGSSSITIYPNPAQTVLYVNGVTNNNSKITITVNDALGKNVIRKQCSELNNVPINVSELNSGIYFITIIVNDKRSVQKFIKQ